jgi:hypothetical protein
MRVSLNIGRPQSVEGPEGVMVERVGEVRTTHIWNYG